MTREEAINWLSPYTSPAMIHKAEERGENPMDYINQAIELAIEALNSPLERYGIERNKDWFCGDAERRTDEFD